MDRFGFRRLSWSGHDFVDSVRSSDLWDKTKSVAAAGGWTLDLLAVSAKAYLELRFKEILGRQS